MSRLIVGSIAVGEPEGVAVRVFILSAFDAAHRPMAGSFLGPRVLSCRVLYEERRRTGDPAGASTTQSEGLVCVYRESLSPSVFLGFFLSFDCCWFVHLFEEGGLDSAVLMAELVVASRHAAISRDS